MAINNAVQQQTQYNRDSSFASQSQALARLNNLRNSLDVKNNDLALQFQQQRTEKQIQDLEKVYDYAVKLQGSKEKLDAKYQSKINKQKEKLDDADFNKWKAKEDKKYKKQLDNYQKLIDAEAKKAEKQRNNEEAQFYASNISNAVVGLGNISKTNNIWSTVSTILDNSKAGGLGSTLDGLVSGISSLAKQLDNQIDTIASYESAIDTRLLGTGKTFEGINGISQKITGVAGLSPFIQQKDVMNKIDDYVKKGIAYNVEQRAFLEVISDKIATTFDAANGTLLQLVRVQQADTTAARLGEEAALNSYLNSMFQTTEYLSDVSTSVKSSLYEATAQLSATAGVGLEYTVQKWLGSLYSVGMSSSSVSNIASALGMLGSGNVSGLASNSAMQNLLVMSASKAGLSYAQLLTEGLDSSNTNKLMEAMVEYLSEIANSNKVVQSQYASVFGMSMSDITSAKNLTSSLQNIYNSNLDYNGALSKLYSTASTIYSRTSLGEMMENMWENTKYSMSAGIASNPAIYAIWKAANLLEDTVGGINIPAISVMGNSVDLETTVADIMRVGALSSGILSSIGSMIAAGSGGGLSTTGMLNALGISSSGLSVLTRGTGTAITTSGTSISQSSYIGNSSSSDIYDSTMAGATDTKNSAMASATEEDNSPTITDVNENIVKIYDLFNNIISGGALKVSLSDTIGASSFN